MKKFSISLIALCAITFAITSAFTTTKTIDPGWYVAASEAVEISDLPISYSTPTFASDDLGYEPSENSATPGQCSANEGYVCAVKFDESGEYDDDFVAGDFNQ